MAKGIDLQSLTVGYKNPVIEQATFTVEQGDIVALIGPNGASIFLRASRTNGRRR